MLTEMAGEVLIKTKDVRRLYARWAVVILMMEANQYIVSSLSVDVRGY